MKTTLLFSFSALIALVAACGGSKEPAATASSSGASPGSEVPRDSKECGFVTGDKCFTNAKDACAQAGCSEDQCLQAESHPVQISCKNKK